MCTEEHYLRARILAAITRAELDAIALDMEGLGCVDLEGLDDDDTTSVDDARALLLASLDADTDVQAVPLERAVTRLARFVCDGMFYSGEQMLQANAHDEDVCAWVRNAEVGDTYPCVIGLSRTA